MLPVWKITSKARYKIDKGEDRDRDSDRDRDRNSGRDWDRDRDWDRNRNRDKDREIAIERLEHNFFFFSEKA